MANGKVNTKIKDMNIECTDLKRKKLYDFLDKRLILYFYPKDMTPGCTTESIEFNESLSKIKKLKANLVGVSRDKISLHEKFINKHDFKFPLISDTDEKLCKAYDVMKEKSMYGKKFMGIERSTFLINPNGEIIREWRKVKVPGHVEEVLSELKEAY